MSPSDQPFHRSDGNDFASALQRSRLERAAAFLIDVDAAIAMLPPEEQAEYERCQQSIIDARRHAEREAHKHWIG